MLSKTQMEAEAMFQARLPFYEALVKCGSVEIPLEGDLPLKVNVAGIFERLTAEQIDSIIEAVWDGLRASMSQQSATGEIPLPLPILTGAPPPPAIGETPLPPDQEAVSLPFASWPTWGRPSAAQAQQTPKTPAAGAKPPTAAIPNDLPDDDLPF